MSETSRYLLLERRIRASAGRPAPGCLRPTGTDPGADPDGWTGTAERLPGPDTGPAVRSSSVPYVARAFDDGGPIELYVDDRHVCPPRADAGADVRTPAPDDPYPPAPSPRAAPETAETAPPPAALSRQRSEPPPEPAPSPATPSVDELAAIDDDDAFAQRLRELVDHAGSPSAPAPVTSPDPAPGPVAAPPAGPPSPAPPEPGSTPDAEPENRYGVFDRIGDALAAPRTFDLGSVPVDAAFDAIERAMDRAERPRPVPAEPDPPALDRVDLVEDFALMPAALAAPAPAPFVPSSPDTLVIGRKELPAPAGVTLRNWTSPGVTQYTAPTPRAQTDVRQIVIHETVSDRWNGLRKGLGVHFHLDRDGTLVQHGNLLDKLAHAEVFNGHSVGIEVVNLVYDTDATPDKDEAMPHGDRVPIAWGAPFGTHYVLPPAGQMETLAQTVRALRTHLGIPDAWPQVMPHPDPARAAGDRSGRTYFLVRTAGHEYLTSARTTSWTASHSALIGHDDGAFPTLYCWLRLHKAMTPENAYQMARQIVEDPGGHRRTTYSYSKTAAPLQMLDITDVA